MSISVCAQTPSPTPASANDNQERTIITGDPIAVTEMESAVPVTVYTAESMQKAGAITPIEGLRQLPEFVGNTATENNSSGGDGSAFINLYALGSNNVLTLINNRRAFRFSDINAISIGALARAEILKSAYAIYGSNGVAGVVNFVMLNGPGEQPYEGAELYALYGNTTDTDAHVRQAYVKGGVTGLGGKVAIAATGEYYSRANLFARDRNISRTGDLSNDSTGLGLGGINNNSPTFAGRVQVAVSGSSLGFPTGQLVLSDLSTPGSGITPAAYRPFDVPLGTDPSRFNFRAFTPAIPAQEMAKYYVTGRYKIFGEGLQIYGDVMYSKTKQDNGLEASPVTLGTAARASPFNPFGGALNNAFYRTVNDLGLRRSFFDTDYYRYTVGLNGDFNIKDNSFISRWGYDTGLVYERYDQLRIDAGDLQFTPLVAEIQAGNFNPFIGQNAPLEGVGPTYSINAAGQPVPSGSRAFDNAAAAQRAAYIGHSESYEADWLADIRFNAHLFPNLENGGFDIAAGYEHRQVRQHSVPDPLQANGDQLGFDQAPNTKTKQEVDSFFGEIGIPIVVATMNIPFVRSLEVEFAYRYEWFRNSDQFSERNNAEFNNGGTPRLTLRYQPFGDLLLRASWQQSIRSPTVEELFAPVAQTFPVFFGPAGGIPIQPPEGLWLSGNPALAPEKTDHYSAGVVWAPEFIPGFTLTADWYQFYTTNLIVPAANAAQVLLSQGTIDPDGFGNGSRTSDGPGGPRNGITRFEDGTLEAIDADVANAGTRFVQGLDVTATYEIPTQDGGKFVFSGGWNHFFTWKAQAGVGDAHNFLGDFSATFPLTPGSIPFNKAFLRGEWQWKGFDFIATGNYIGDYEDDPNFILGNDIVPGTDPASNNPGFILHRRVSDYITLDLQLSYEWKKPELDPVTGYSKDAKDAESAPVAAVDNSTIWQRMLWNTKLTMGVNNVFDRQPPSLLGASNDNYDTSLYSIRNRYYYIALSKKF